MITILACPNLDFDKRIRVIIDLTNNGLGCTIEHFPDVNTALDFVRRHMNESVPM